MIYKKVPLDFNPRFEVVSCFVKHRETIILLHRNINKSQGNRWGVPAGKVSQGELLNSAMIRELQEETGIEIAASRLRYVDKYFIRHSEYQFIYHVFTASLGVKPRIRLNFREHQNFRWVSLSEALGMNLVEDLDECIKSYCMTRSIWN